MIPFELLWKQTTKFHSLSANFESSFLPEGWRNPDETEVVEDVFAFDRTLRVPLLPNTITQNSIYIFDFWQCTHNLSDINGEANFVESSCWQLFEGSNPLYTMYMPLSNGSNNQFGFVYKPNSDSPNLSASFGGKIAVNTEQMLNLPTNPRIGLRFGIYEISDDKLCKQFLRGE